MLDKEMFSENENSLMNYTYEDFKELFLLIPKITESNNYNKKELLKALEEALYSSKVLVDFDFNSWELGLKIAEDDNFDLSSLNIIDLCKLLTSILGVPPPERLFTLIRNKSHN